MCAHEGYETSVRAGQQWWTKVTQDMWRGEAMERFLNHPDQRELSQAVRQWMQQHYPHW